MGTKGENTRERIMTVAENIILQKGYSGTSIDEVIAASYITKGGFFYHFKGKNDLAKQLILRYLDEDRKIFTGLFAQATDLSEDPLHQMLIFLKLLADMMGNLHSKHPGCLIASYTYESEQFDDEIRQLVVDNILSWRELFSDYLDKIDERYSRVIETSTDELADMLTSIIEGGIVISKALNDPNLLVQQILQYRAYIRLLYGNV